MYTITCLGVLAALVFLGVLLGKCVEASNRCAVCKELYPSTNHLMKHATAKDSKIQKEKHEKTKI